MALEPVLKLAFVDQAGLELTEACHCLPSAGIKGVHHHCLAESVTFFSDVFCLGRSELALFCEARLV